MVVLGQEPIMFESPVLYIGSAPPVETLKGLDAIQEPLRKRYPENLSEVVGADAKLCVLPTVLEMRYVGSGETVQWPLDRLSICAGVRVVTVVDGTTGKQSRQFVPVNTIQPESDHPAIFAAIIRRNKGRQIAECHMFICNSTRDALHLVNAAATANMALRKQHGRRVETTTQGNDVIVVKSGVANGYSDAEHNSAVNYEQQSYRQPDYDTVRIETNESNLDSTHFQIQQSTVSAPEPETIYITFDKSNLKPKGDGNLEVTHTARQSRRSEEYSSRPTYVEAPAPSPVPVYRPMYMNGPPPPRHSYTIRHVSPPPQPMMMQRPVLVRPPPPPQPMLVRQPMYTKRVIAPPPPPRYVSQPPMVVRSRARSASPIGRYSSEIRPSKKGTYQPKWEGNARSKSEAAAPRMSRREMYDYPPPPPQNIEFFQQAGSPREMHLNERAFSRRMHADHRITRDHQGYHYPTAYDLHSAMLYDRPTTKSNPRYSSSSSSSSDEGGRNRIRSSRR